MTEKADLATQTEVTDFLQELFIDDSQENIEISGPVESQKQQLELNTGEVIDVELVTKQEVKDFLIGLFDNKSD